MGVAAVAMLSGAAGAQVGHLPQNSPYTDIDFRQELTAYTGYYDASRDPAGVAPRGGAMAGLLYQVRLGGPAHLVARGARVFSTRTVLNPGAPADLRVVGDRNVSLYLMDLGIALNLTGQKSWHHVVPVVGFGLGVASDFTKADLGNYRFGTPFAFSFGTGLHWVPGGNIQVRADVTDYLYQLAYPSSYFTPQSSDDSAILGPGVSKRSWKNNGAFTLGISYLFFR